MNDTAPNGQTVDPELVTYEDLGDHVVGLTLNRPEKLNAFSDGLVLSLRAALLRFDADPDAWVAVLSGAGRAFSSGADVHQRQLRDREELVRFGGPQAPGAKGAEMMYDFVNWKPVVAAVHGYAIGMALGLILECEVIVASEEARFQVTETPRGLSPTRYHALLQYRGWGGFASEVAVTGRWFTAGEAAHAGVINQVAPAGGHLDAAIEVARQIASNPPLSVRAAVRSRRWYLERLEREAQFHSAPLKLHLTQDFNESARAFAEKRSTREYTGS